MASRLHRTARLHQLLNWWTIYWHQRVLVERGLWRLIVARLLVVVRERSRLVERLLLVKRLLGEDWILGVDWMLRGRDWLLLGSGVLLNNTSKIRLRQVEFHIYEMQDRNEFTCVG